MYLCADCNDKKTTGKINLQYIIKNNIIFLCVTSFGVIPCTVKSCTYILIFISIWRDCNNPALFLWQYFITVDNDVYIETKDWIDCFMRVFKAFPNVGLLGVQRGEPYSDSIPPVIPRKRDKISYLELDKKSPFSEQNYIPGCCQCLSPSLLKEIGFWNEENGFGDVDLTLRVKQYTRYNAGFVTDINIEMPQVLECEKCQYQKQCELIQNDETKNEETCFTIYQKLYKNDVFKKKYYWRFVETKKDITMC